MLRRLILILTFAAGAGCASDPPVDGSESDAGGDLKNACGGNGRLLFLGRAASPADRCGTCGTGALVCMGPAMLICVGSRDASCSEGGTINACGGQRPLVLDGAPALPGQSCGACRDGTVICTAPDVVACVAASSESVCRDGGSVIDVSDAAILDAGRDGDAADAERDASAADARETDPSDVPRDVDIADTTRDATDAAREADAMDAYDSDSSLDATSLDAPPTAGDVALPNVCGGMGPLLWKGVPSAPGQPCGACTGGFLKCGSPTALVCGASCPDAGASETCDIPSSAYTAPAPVLPTPPSEPVPTATTAAALTLMANDLVYNPFDFRLYASVSSQQGPEGNSIAVIDPYAGTLVKTIFVGSEPTKLALSDDGQSLWVALDGAASVRQVDLQTATAGRQFSVGAAHFSRQSYARDIAALPGTRDSVVVTRYSKVSTGDDGLIVYDNGVPRPYSAGYGNYTAEGTIVTHSPFLVFSYRSGLTVACVNANGVFKKQTVASSASVTQGNFAFVQNVIYTGNGIAYDIASATTLGTYAGRGAVAADASKRRVYFLSSTQAANVSAYNMDTFLATGSETLSVGNATTGDHFVLWGRHGYAFRAGNQIIIARSALTTGP
jgi:hypothetical protein